MLALYDPQANTRVSADASSFGLGVVLLQEFNDVWRPVAYASHAMTNAERRYAQVEKEALTVTWACEKCGDYILGGILKSKLITSPSSLWIACRASVSAEAVEIQFVSISPCSRETSLYR